MKISDTYEKYMQLISSASAQRLREESHLILERFRQSVPLPSAVLPTIFFVDYTTRKYIYIDSNCFDVVGHPDSYYYENGHEGFLRQTHPADYAAVSTKVFPVNLHFLETIPPGVFDEYIFSHNFRIRDYLGNYRIILQRYSYVADDRSPKPVAVVGVAYDITHFKTGPGIIHTIERSVLSGQKREPELLYKETHPVYETGLGVPLTKKELEILPYLAKGWSSKQIAGTLRRSVSTVSNHRKSMLRKTGCSTTAGLVQYAIRNGLL